MSLAIQADSMPNISYSSTILRLPLSVVLIAFTLTACTSEGERPRDLSTGSGWTLPSDDELRALLAERMEHNGVGIVVGVIDADGRRVVSHGRSEASDGRPLDGATVFQIGSVSKGITTLLLAEMVTREEVGLDDPAVDYLPEGVGMPELGRPITLRDLATHTSGLPTMPTNFDLHGMPDPYEAYSVTDLHTFLSNYALESEPGTARNYSNLGVALLGRLLANRMGTDYETLIKERVLTPLRMTSTSINLSVDQQSRLAPGHDPYLQPVRTWEMATLPASGSLRSTVDDVLNLMAAYLGYSRTPSLRSAMELQLEQSTIVGDDRYALGWGILSDGTVRHSGGKQGYRSGVAFNRHTGIGAVVLANSRTTDLPIDLAVHLVTGEPLPPAPEAPAPKRRVQLTPDELDRFLGRYRLGGGGEVEVASNAEGLVMRYEDGAVYGFVASGPLDFFYNAGNDDITFEVDPGGQVISLVRYGDGKAEGGGEVAVRVAS